MVLVVVLVLRLVVVPVLGLRVGAVLMVGMMRGLELPVAARVEAIVGVRWGSCLKLGGVLEWCGLGWECGGLWLRCGDAVGR